MTGKNIEAIYPLSSMQQGMLFECLSAPESGVYVQQLFCTLRGNLDISAFQTAWQQVLDHHAALRTLFVWNRGEKPLQVVRRKVALPFEFQEWSGIPQAERQEWWRSLLEADRARGFTFSDAPLLHVVLLQTAHDTYRLLFSFHHLILDGWSLPLLFKEVFDVYGRQTEGQRLPATHVRPYRDYIRWLQKQDPSRAQTYWRRALRGFDAPTQLANNSARLQNTDGNIFFERQIQFSSSETARLQAAAKQQGRTLSILVQAAWAILLGRHSCEQDVVFGLTVSGRSADLAGIETMIGLFINTLPVRAHVQPEQPLRSWLKELQTRQMEMTQYEHSPLSQVRKWSEIPAGARLFESIVVFENYPLDASLLRKNNGLTIDDIQAVEVTNYPLTVTAVPHSDLRILISYDCRCFDDAAVTRMLGHMRTILLSMAATPDQLIRDVAWITPAERDQLLVAWNQTAAENPPEKRIHAMFEARVRRSPEHIAVTSGAKRLTYAELDERANQLANYLRRLGVREETFVGLCAERSLEMVVGILGIFKAGGVYLPLDPSWPAHRKAFVLTETRAPLLLADKGWFAGPAAFEGHVVNLDAEWEEIGREPACNPVALVNPNSLAYAIYTSGTTGRPKGVMISRQALCNHLRWMQAAFPLTPEDRVPQKYSLSFDVSVLEVFYPLLAGAQLVVAPPLDYFDSARLVDFLIDNKITAIDLVPSMLRALVQERRFPLLTALRQVTCGGDILPSDLQREFFARSPAELANLYGPTEVTIGATSWRCARGDEQPLVPIGHPIANTDVYILDRHMDPVPIGVAGEICIGGMGLARGYLHDPVLTAQKFFPHGYSHIPGQRLYRTGDRGRYRADGNIEYIGRADQQVKIRGYRIEPGEIEAVLRGHPAVREVVVLAHERQLVAYLAGVQADRNDLRQYLKEYLPEYMLPAHFIWLDRIPILANGKVDRGALPAPEARHAPREGHVPPRNAMEEAFVAIWSAVLNGVHVGVEDNFFELGGDSIISLQVVARAQQRGIRITPRQLFECPTIAALAAVAEPVEDSLNQSAERGIVEGEVPLTPIQRWFFEQGMEEVHHYNQAVLLEAGEELNSEWLETAWKKLAEHHDALRLRYRSEQGEWRQRNAGREESRFFSVVELKGNREEQARELERVIDEMQQSLELESGPVLRVAHIKPDRVVVVIHHLVVDGVSWRIMVEDLESAYRQLSRGEAIRLPARTTSYQRWAEALSRGAEAGRYEEELGYWLREGEEELTAEKMPRDREGGENREASRRQVKVELDGEQTRQLLQEAPGAYHTQINDLLLAAVLGAWEKWTGQSRLLIDMEGHGREGGEEGMDLSRTVGWFTAVYPVRLEVGKEEGPGERLKGIKEQLRRVPGQGVGYGVLRYMNKDRRVKERLGGLPAAEISFNYLGQVDAGAVEEGLFQKVEALEENSRGARNRRSHLLEVEGRVQGGRLQVEWMYSQETHRRETIEALARSFVEELGGIIRHCLAPGVGGFTPSDFPLARLDQQTLDLLANANRSMSDTYPLSPIQQGLLFHTLYDDPHSGTYVEQLRCTLEGNVNVQAFEDAWRDVVDCHPALRSSFVWEGLQEPLQIVHQSAKVSFIHHDWSQLAGNLQQRLEDLRQADVEQGFDLASPPLMRFTLVQVAPGRFEFIWSSHHLLLDGWGMSLVLQELIERYEAGCAGTFFKAVPSRPYRDYIAWIRRQDLARAKEYWEDRLKGFQLAVPLPGENPTQSVSPDKEYSEKQRMLPADATAHLQAMARQQQITLSGLTQAAWALLLRYYTGHRDLLFGVTVSGRPAELAGVDRMVGLFINTLPLRLSLSSEATIDSVLKELQQQQLLLDEYAYTPLSGVQEWSEIPAGLPLFETVVVFENYPVDASLKEARGELKFGNVCSRGSTNYPLTLIVRPGPTLALQLSYDARRFEARMIDQMLRHLEHLLAGIASGPMQCVCDLHPLSQAERRQLLVEWNGVETAHPREKCLHQLFEEQARRTPAAVALVCEGAQLSYGELNRRANQLGHHLRKEGVGPDTRVAICMERSLDMVTAILGVLKAGGAYVPVDPGYPEARLQFIVEDAQAAVLLTSQALRGKLTPTANVNVLGLDEPEMEAALFQQPAHNPGRILLPQYPAYVIYTSGSTGTPKGVVVTHANVTRLFASTERWFHFGPLDVWTLFHSYAFDFSVWELWGALLHGGRLVVVPKAITRSPAEFLELLVAQRVTVLNQTPSAFYQLMQVDEENAALSRRLELRTVIFGGEALELARLQSWYARHREDSPLLVNMYGITETTVHVTYMPLSEEMALRAGGSPIGANIPDLRVYVLNEDFQPVPVGVMGEMCVAGAGLAQGYLNRPELTAERFVPNPFSDGGAERLYRSGDVAKRSENGNLIFVGRADRQVKLRGYRIELGEIECLLRQYEPVREAVVTVHESESGDKALVAHVVMRPDRKFSLADLQSCLKSRMPDYMRPGIFVPLDKLPLTPNGKVDYKALPRPETSSISGSLILPRTPVEHAVAEIWRQVFGILKLSVDDNFFHLGGHSLLALQIASRVRTVLGVALPLRSVFEQPTIADQARAIEKLLGSAGSAASVEIRPLARPDNLPLSSAQRRLWFLHQLEPTSDFYNIPIALRIHGPLNADVLSDCCNEVVRRHEILRTAFPIRQGAPVQQIAEAVRSNLAVTSLEHLPLEQAEATAGELISGDAKQPFNLSRGPLLRLSLLRLAKDDHVLHLNMHHIVVDGWSLGVFMRELALLYEAGLDGRPSPLPPLPIQYADYALWQRDWLSAETLEADLAYWRQQLSGASGPALPTDHPRPKVQTFRGARRSVSFAPQFVESLKELARREHATLFMALLAAFKVLLYRYTGQAEITVGTPVAGRTRQEIEPLIGFFVNTLALQTRVFGRERFTELLHQVREVSLGAYAHQDLPFDKLVEELHPHRDPGRTPFFQVMFALDDILIQELMLPGLRMSPIEVETHIAKFDLTLTVSEGLEGLAIAFEYNSDLFEDATIERMMNHFERLLHGIVANPKRHIFEIPLLSEEERLQVLVKWNNTTMEYPRERGIRRLFEEQVQRAPKTVAVVFQHRKLSYEELNTRANQIANYLIRTGVGPEVRVGLCMDRSLETIVSLLGILKAGGVYVALDAGSPRERLKLMLEECGARVVLAHRRLRELLPEMPSVRILCVDEEWERIAEESDADPRVEVGGEHLAYISYTSGSTGRPKGVSVPHRGVVRLVRGNDYALLGAEEVMLQFAPLAFDASTLEVWGSLLNGGRLVVMGPGPRSTEEIGQTLVDQGVTTVWLTAGLFNAMVDEQLEKLKQVRQVLAGGEALSVAHVNRYLAVMPEAGVLINGYGPTENTTFTCCHRLRRGEVMSAAVPIGRPIGNTQVYVLDEEMQPVAVGVEGDLYIAGDGLARGYENDPAQTAEKFVPRQYGGAGDRLYCSGDRARWRPDGTMVYVGRSDQQIKIRGFRIELGEIEAIMRQHATVSQAVVTLREDQSGERRLVAYVMVKNGSEFCVDSLREFVRTKLPEYMVPAAMVQMDEIPLTASGKTDYNGLPLVSSVGTSTPDIHYVAPRNPIEERIAEACCHLLSIQRIGIHDNFFDLGGHSLLAMRLMTWAHETFQSEAVPLRGFFETPTIAGLAALIVACEPRPGQTEKIAKFLQQLDAMSPQEVMTLRTKHTAHEAAHNVVAKDRSRLL